MVYVQKTHETQDKSVVRQDQFFCAIRSRFARPPHKSSGEAINIWGKIMCLCLFTGGYPLLFRPFPCAVFVSPGASSALYCSRMRTENAASEDNPISFPS